MNHLAWPSSYDDLSIDKNHQCRRKYFQILKLRILETEVIKDALENCSLYDAVIQLINRIGSLRVASLPMQFRRFVIVVGKEVVSSALIFVM
jgi:hypothetical protein